ncbi:hypothetical protein [Saliterribacillus persicus]|uniref:Uncharacterized protein n=1 Tax=Saliterribacillus persicus TaxID=930114 RepID=A0A368X3H2_9BACI|nr:hypothetical protein [Saliterribacillus persicus]RCW62572.1 hypothetical protein DFR57_12515 [Saliterribacillus persicus]
MNEIDADAFYLAIRTQENKIKSLSQELDYLLSVSPNKNAGIFEQNLYSVSDYLVDIYEFQFNNDSKIHEMSDILRSYGIEIEELFYSEGTTEKEKSEVIRNLIEEANNEIEELMESS